MKKYNINGIEITLDISKSYLDFYIESGAQRLIQVNLEGMLNDVQKGKYPINEFKQYMGFLKRWAFDAPRKKLLKKLKQEGYNVTDSQQLFEMQDGDYILDSLENTGKFAEYFLSSINL